MWTIIHMCDYCSLNNYWYTTDGSLWKRKIRCYSLACTLHKQAKHQLTVENHMPCSFQTTHCIDLASLSPIYPSWTYFFILFTLSHCQRFCTFLLTPILKFSQSSLSVFLSSSWSQPQITCQSLYLTAYSIPCFLMHVHSHPQLWRNAQRGGKLIW